MQHGNRQLLISIFNVNW